MFDPTSQTASPTLAEEGESLASDPAEACDPTKFSPARAATEERRGTGDGALDWQMHAVPGIDIPLAAITGSRSDWTLKTRGNSAAKLDDHGRWTNLGPDNAVYPLNPCRNRFVYVPNDTSRPAERHTASSTRTAGRQLPLLDRERGRRHLAD